MIEKQLFETVQKHFEGRKKPGKTGEMEKYAGCPYCADCGEYQTFGKAYCTAHYIRETVLESIRRILRFAGRKRTLFIVSANDKM